MNTQEMIKKVAEYFEWNKLGGAWLIECVGTCPYDMTEGQSLFLFIAYAEAEFSQKGVDIIDNLEIQAYIRTGELEVTATDCYLYDKTDPISKATAKLRCMCAVIDKIEGGE